MATSCRLFLVAWIAGASSKLVSHPPQDRLIQALDPSSTGTSLVVKNVFSWLDGLTEIKDEEGLKEATGIANPCELKPECRSFSDWYNNANVKPVLYMSRDKLTVKQVSEVVGKGVFATDKIPRGSLITKGMAVCVKGPYDATGNVAGYGNVTMNSNTHCTSVMPKKSVKEGEQCMADVWPNDLNKAGNVNFLCEITGNIFVNHDKDKDNANYDSETFLVRNGKLVARVYNLVATKDIQAGEEVLINYGDDTKFPANTGKPSIY